MFITSKPVSLYIPSQFHYIFIHSPLQHLTTSAHYHFWSLCCLTLLPEFFFSLSSYPPWQSFLFAVYHLSTQPCCRHPDAATALPHRLTKYTPLQCVCVAGNYIPQLQWGSLRILVVGSAAGIIQGRSFSGVCVQTKHFRIQPWCTCTKKKVRVQLEKSYRHLDWSHS